MSCYRDTELHIGVGNRGFLDELSALPHVVSSLRVPLSPIAKPPLMVNDNGHDSLLKDCSKREGRLLAANEKAFGGSKPNSENVSFPDCGSEEESEHFFVNESAVWKQIEKSLTLPAIYRRKEDLNLTLRMLSRVPLLKKLSKEELLALADGMKMLSFPTSGCVAWEKAAYTGEVAGREWERGKERREANRWTADRSIPAGSSAVEDKKYSQRNELSGGRLVGRPVRTRSSNRSVSSGEEKWREGKNVVREPSKASGSWKMRSSSGIKSNSNFSRVEVEGKECGHTHVSSTNNHEHKILGLPPPMMQVMVANPDVKSSDLGINKSTPYEISSSPAEADDLRHGSSYRLAEPSDVSRGLENIAGEKKSRIQNHSLALTSQGKQNNYSTVTALSSYLAPSDVVSPVFILARGKMLLEMPTINGTQYYPFLPLDAFGHELWTSNLPDEAKCITTEACTVVVLDHADKHLHSILDRANKLLLEEQKRFLRDELQVKIFESWDEVEFEECAKCLLPLRVESFQIVIEEEEVSDALYFLKEGQLTVTRIVKPQLQKKKFKPFLPPPGSFSQLQPLGAPLSASLLANRDQCPFRHLHHATLLPNEHVMQVASLQPGEFFGELGLLAHDPDVRPGEHVVWTDKYWVGALSSRFQQSHDAVAAESSFLKELCRKKPNARHQDNEGSQQELGQEGEKPSISPPSQRSIESGSSRRRFSKVSGLSRENDGVKNKNEGNSSMEDDDGFEPCSHALMLNEDEPIDQRYPFQTTLRKATVYAQLPSVLYRLSYEHCRQKIGGLSLTRLLEFMKGYPSHDDVYEQFEKQLKWTVYRDELIAGILQQNRKANRKEHLPKLKMK